MYLYLYLRVLVLVTSLPVIEHIGSWEMECFGLDSATTNQSESFNAVLKRLQQWKEVPVDAMVLSLKRLADFHLAEVQRGYAGLGNYDLRPGLPAPVAVVDVGSVVDPRRQLSTS